MPRLSKDSLEYLITEADPSGALLSSVANISMSGTTTFQGISLNDFTSAVLSWDMTKLFKGKNVL